MRAVTYDRYGPPEAQRLEEVEQPVPKDDEVLIKIHATTVNRTDCEIRDANRRNGLVVMLLSRLLTGLRRPKQRILGSELAGEVVAVGAAVRSFAIGDRVFGVKAWTLGAHAEYICMRESGALAPMPVGMTFEEAAAVCDGGILALQGLQAAKVRQGQRILVYGASGSIGTAGVQLATAVGAHVTAVCSGKNVELVRSLGASEVIDYTHEDFTKNGETYDLIFDAVGKTSFRRCHGSLKPSGVFLASDGLANIMRAALTKRSKGSGWCLKSRRATRRRMCSSSRS
jgi:NADPH:quinone reductase-like Zn-dependent oxidoreductase